MRERRIKKRSERGGSSPLGQARERERHVSDASWHNCENSKDRLTRAWPRDIDCSNLSNEKIIKWIEDECIMEHEGEGWEGMGRTRWRRGGGKQLRR